MNTALWILVILFATTTIFLAKEIFKKFSFMKQFIESSNQLVEWQYDGSFKPGMQNIVIRGEKPFAVLIGFELKIFGSLGFDYYGYVQSNEAGIAVISTYLGRTKTRFQFFVNCDLNQHQIHASSTDEDQALIPQAVYPPHWWQRLGFYS